MSDVKFTPEQQLAVSRRGGSLLVSAAAGSGKTKVLVERLLTQVENEQCDVGDFLIITYTRAAAAELRGRILDELTARSADAPGNRHLRRQAALIYGADIGTIHSFCGKILREYAHRLDIRPDFRMADEAEAGALKADALDDVLEDRYSGMSAHPGFSLLADTLSLGRSDEALGRIVLDTHARLQSNPEPRGCVETWLQDLERFSGVSDVSQTPWGAYLMEQALAVSRYWLARMSESQFDVESDEIFSKGYGESWSETVDSLNRFCQALERGWDAVHACGKISFPRPKTVKGIKETNGYQKLTSLRARCHKQMDAQTDRFTLESLEAFGDLTASAPILRALFDLVLDFDEAYSALKRRRGVMDFSDLEHMALRLLISEDGSPSEAAHEIASRYQEVMVDEFQDVNAVQDKIFRALTESGNLFMVGDVKQSIYGFRLADPGIFLDYYQQFPDAELADETGPGKVLLSKNFRSAGGVLDAVNFVFSRIMSKDLGDMDYTQREYLRAGLEGSPEANAAVELDLLDVAGLPEEMESAELEADYVADRIQALLRGGKYAPGDIAILLRATKGKARRYQNALAARGIPAATEQGADLYESGEVLALLSLLDVLDNPTRDVSLIAAMRSQLYGFTSDELAEIRLAGADGCFYDALKAAAGESEKCRAFLAELEGLRKDAADMPVPNLLWTVIDRRSALEVYGAMSNGPIRRQNILLFVEQARSAEASGTGGLFSVLASLKAAAAAGKTQAAAAGGQGVQIMTIHKSKGLEFPVVILADLGKRFNDGDLKENVLVHPTLGAGVRLLDFDRKIRYSTFMRDAIAERKRRQNLAEEMRILYVGMTRPKEKLIMTASIKNLDKRLLDLAAEAEETLSPTILQGAGGLIDWVLLPLLLRPERAALNIPGEALVQMEPQPHKWDIHCIHWSDVAAEQEEPEPIPESCRVPAPSADPVLTEDIFSRITWAPAQARNADLPSKLTATELKGKLAAWSAQEDAAPLKVRPGTLVRPQFVTEARPLTGTERGTAAHLVMQYADFGACTSIEGVGAEILRLMTAGFLTPAQAKAVQPEALFRFFDSPLGRRARQAENLQREFRFSLLVRAEDFFPDGGEEEILLQGVVDCFFEEEGAIHIIDFKSDYVTEESLAEKVAEYRAQLKTYGMALSRILEKPVGERFLYFFRLGRAVAVPSDTPTEGAPYSQ